MDEVTDYQQLAKLIGSHRESAVIASENLGPNSRVVVAGAYKGDTIAFLRELFDCYVAGYEPQPWAFDRCYARFGADPKVHLFPYALGTSNEWLPMWKIGTDGATLEPVTGENSGLLVDVRDALTAPISCNLLVLNIEGYEHTLLPYLSNHGRLSCIDAIIMQWHGEARLAAGTRVVLERTHRPTWIWGSWERWALS